MSKRPPRLAARAVIVHVDRLLLVNAWRDPASALWCAPGGGVEPGSSLPDNLQREVFEETGLTVSVGAPCLINEFHDPNRDFHQVEVFFRCQITSGEVSDSWQDPEGVVSKRGFFTENELPGLHLRPKALINVAFRPDAALAYDPLETIVF